MTQAASQAPDAPDASASGTAPPAQQPASPAVNAPAGAELQTIPLPRDGKWPDESRAALGVPEKPEGYALRRPGLPEGLPYDESFEGEMRTAAHELGLAPWQLQGLLDAYAGYAARQFGDLGRMAEEARRDAEAELAREWGLDYSLKLERARRTVAAFGGDKAVADLNASGLGNHPALIRMLAAIGAELGEDSLVQGDKGGAPAHRDPAAVLYGS